VRIDGRNHLKLRAVRFSAVIAEEEVFEKQK